MGDPLDIIASGPTVIDDDPAAAARRALDVLQQFGLAGDRRHRATHQLLLADLGGAPSRPSTTQVLNLVIGNNRTATEAAAQEARRRGYRVHVAPPQPAQATAEETGRWLADRLVETEQHGPSRAPWCLISGGEPVVKLIEASRRGRGGRNQQLALAALCHLIQRNLSQKNSVDRLLHRQVILSGGTDGEDGPTDAAGAWIDRHVVQQMLAQQLDPATFLRHNDAYSFFQTAGGLIRTGPTHTNVCDVRLALAHASVHSRTDYLTQPPSHGDA